MRIVTGALRGRVIPSSRVLQSIRLTSSRLKEAVFSMVGDDLTGLAFLDLCAGSGQIGLEAASRGAGVWMNEPDERRWTQIAGLVRQWQVANVQLCRDKGQVLIERLQAAGQHFDLTYVDPPYDATRHGRPLSVELLERLGASTVVAPRGFVLVQHQAELRLADTVGDLAVTRRREYGATSLTIYAHE
jgi:16S rRNA (guanine(966)-N(2))-methyltransferase RsmD